MRYRDKKDIIVGLKYKITRNRPDKENSFVIDPSKWK